jgi:hypothetical protein
MLNPLAINPIGVYQQLVQQAQYNIPSLLPVIKQLSATEKARQIDELPLDVEQHQQIELHTRADYSHWLKHLYQNWQDALQKNMGNHSHPKPSDDIHWYPESTAKFLNDIALAYAGWLWHKAQVPLPDTVERITLLWRETWQIFNEELEQSHANIGVTEAMNNTADCFHQLWLESWLHLSQLQGEVPTSPQSSNETLK